MRDVLALLVFLCFAPGIWELWEVLALFQRGAAALGLVAGLGVGLGSFWLPQGRCGLGQAPLLLQPWSGHKSPGRGMGTTGASLGGMRCLGRDNVDLPPWEAHPAFPGLQAEDLGDQYELNVAPWGCPLAQGSPGKAPSPWSRDHPLPHRIQPPKGCGRGSGCPPTHSQDIPLTPPLHIPCD